MACVADHDDGLAALAHAHDLAVNLRHQRAGRIENTQRPIAGLLLDGARDAVRREDERGAVGHFAHVVDENGAALAQLVDHGAVVHDLMAHVDGSAEHFNGALDDGDGAGHARTESAGTGKKNLHAWVVSYEE